MSQPVSTKRCHLCGKTKNINLFDSFYHKKYKRMVTYNYCNDCRALSPSLIISLRRTGCTFEQYQKLFENQNGVCAICGQPETRKFRGKITRLHIDHCHTTKKVRGLLCSACNVGLGLFKHNSILLERAAEYLNQ